jgi:hypothetical protein
LCFASVDPEKKRFGRAGLSAILDYRVVEVEAPA